MPQLIGGNVGVISALGRQSRGVQSDVSRVLKYHFQSKVNWDLSVGCVDMSKLLKRNEWSNIRMHIEIGKLARLISRVYVAYKARVLLVVIHENVWEPSRGLLWVFVYVSVFNDPSDKRMHFWHQKFFTPPASFLPPFELWNEICINKIVNASTHWR